MTNGPAQNYSREFSLPRRLLSGGLVICLPLLIGYLGALILASAWQFGSGAAAWFQVSILLMGILLLALAVWLAVGPIRRKVRTGRFIPTRAEIAEDRANAWNKLGAGKPLAPQLWLWLIPMLFSAMFVTAGIAAFVAASSGRGPAPGANRAVFVFAALILYLGLVYPFSAIRRRLRTGSFLPSRKEIAERRARYAKPRPLPQRLAVATLWLLIALAFTSKAIRNPRHLHAYSGVIPPWPLMALSWLCAAVYTWQLLCPAASVCAPPPDSGQTAIETPRFPHPQ